MASQMRRDTRPPCWAKVTTYNGPMIQVTATEYKNNSLKLLEQVRASGESVQITKRGRPIALLVRVDDAGLRRIAGQHAGEVALVGDIIGPIIDEKEWGDNS